MELVELVPEHLGLEGLQQVEPEEATLPEQMEYFHKCTRELFYAFQLEVEEASWKYMMVLQRHLIRNNSLHLPHRHYRFHNHDYHCYCYS